MINIKHHYQYGYTLLELVVVLLLFSLLAGLTIPRLTTMYDSFKNAYERDEVLAHLDSLGYIAFQYAREFDLKTYPPKIPNIDDPKRLKLPKGWQVRAKTPIHFFANGVCTGGLVYLHHQGTTYEVVLKAPFCKPY